MKIVGFHPLLPASQPRLHKVVELAVIPDEGMTPGNKTQEYDQGGKGQILFGQEIKNAMQ